MWVLHSCGDVQLEPLVVRDLVVSNLDTQLASNLHEGLVEQLVEGRIKNLADILQETVLALSDALLELWNELRLVHVEDHQFPAGVHFLEPVDRLCLWVNVESPTEALGDEDTILSRETVSWEVVFLPLVYLGSACHKVTEAIGWSVGNA